MNKEFYIGRQPILDARGHIYAYELLFRQAGEVTAKILDNSSATARVLINAIQNIGLGTLLSGKLGFINVDEHIILEGTLDILPKDNFVIEILETTKVTDELIEKIKFYQEQGYRFALDDMVLSKEYYAMFSRLFTMVDVIKVDYMLCNKENLKVNMQIFKRLRAQLLAEKVETQADYEFCRELGFDLFQGYFFAKPVTISSKSVDPSKAATLQLISMLKKDAEASALEKVIKNYPDLYINLLKFMNSAAFFTKGHITSIKHAMALLGRENLTKWLYLILYAGPGMDSFDNPLLMTAQIRARAMENICVKGHVAPDKAGEAYLVGLMSLMDAVFNKTKEDVMKEFNLDTEIKDAVISHKGMLGKILKTIEDYEKDNIIMLDEHFKALGIKVGSFNEIMLDSFNYACTISGDC
ncbi:diguanylate phosphodiesterase [Denitrovibrio acetiphilus DSM 12809]|uniref:Diguanylate phosphodiesterase n=1 Tax=Denitrovibrio acetiphilus (strain DSM 12809 / NBRC 114555 / N2460) TaxID=522772 RepID=D4H6F5_DENA2|nr:EAL domain-containing protein [Denitrovibrio acetiphilus]ADD69629.1 diguanylate phosphodiesterase [Denitrovibrio acetiphilus DSM 12809]